MCIKKITKLFVILNCSDQYLLSWRLNYEIKEKKIVSDFVHLCSSVTLCDSDEALSKAELSKAELELEINKVKTEEASLRDALLKMQALNEGLGQDKIELNKIIMQVRSII